ncbi:hypothetical protein C8F04DRAFT_1196244 [Mycena alexandri]|uniref:Uncharacterized protein n=1 Tax=Mycena alexandri TaxID=1745969 RepID=A0AAD6WPU5_9AGAR|nr:hypothetical protein C8F04DRAFT_1196244 [Mycena alexandri]
MSEVTEPRRGSVGLQMCLGCAKPYAGLRSLRAVKTHAWATCAVKFNFALEALPLSRKRIKDSRIHIRACVARRKGNCRVASGQGIEKGFEGQEKGRGISFSRVIALGGDLRQGQEVRSIGQCLFKRNKQERVTCRTAIRNGFDCHIDDAWCVLDGKGEHPDVALQSDGRGQEGGKDKQKGLFRIITGDDARKKAINLMNAPDRVRGPFPAKLREPETCRCKTADLGHRNIVREKASDVKSEGTSNKVKRWPLRAFIVAVIERISGVFIPSVLFSR